MSFSAYWPNRSMRATALSRWRLLRENKHPIQDSQSYQKTMAVFGRRAPGVFETNSMRVGGGASRLRSESVSRQLWSAPEQAPRQWDTGSSRLPKYWPI